MFKVCNQILGTALVRTNFYNPASWTCPALSSGRSVYKKCNGRQWSRRTPTLRAHPMTELTSFCVATNTSRIARFSFISRTTHFVNTCGQQTSPTAPYRHHRFYPMLIFSPLAQKCSVALKSQEHRRKLKQGKYSKNTRRITGWLISNISSILLHLRRMV